MANIKVAGVYPVNELGEILVQVGTGTTSLLGYQLVDKIPTDGDTSKMVIRFPDSVGGSVGSIVNVNGVLAANIPNGATYTSIQWLRVIGTNYVDIAGATNITYTPQIADINTIIKFRLVGFNPINAGIIIPINPSKTSGMNFTTSANSAYATLV